MNRIFLAAITPLHKQVPHVDYDRPWYRINMYELPASFDASTGFTTRGAHICYFEAASLVLKEKRQGTEVRVRWITGESAGWEESRGYGRVMDETGNGRGNWRGIGQANLRG